MIKSIKNNKTRVFKVHNNNHLQILGIILHGKRHKLIQGLGKLEGNIIDKDHQRIVDLEV